jgi:hypothetical protein
LGISSNIEMIRSIQKDVCNFYAKAVTFYLEDSSFHWLWVSGSWDPIPVDAEGQLYITEDSVELEVKYNHSTSLGTSFFSGRQALDTTQHSDFCSISVVFTSWDAHYHSRQ